MQRSALGGGRPGNVAFRYGPPPPRANVPRPELFERLDRGARGPLTLVTGPPGAGKTQLLSAWLAARPGLGSVAWLSIEPSDARPARFWGELLHLIEEVSDTRLPKFLGPSGEPTTDFVARLAGAASELPEPVLVVLDDFEQLHSRAVIESLDLFLRTPQRGLRLVIASRLDPSLSLQRLRLEGRLAELRSRDLALRREHVRQLFEMADVELTEQQIERLHVRTEGWVGGLSLAALSLRDHADPDAFVRSFAGDERTVADYLVEQVLRQQPAAIRDFMLRTSVVEELEPALADALTGRTDGALALESLERSNSFLLGLDEDRHRYRYHPMFLELLRSQLRYQMPDAFALAHRRAARWFAANGMPAMAVRHGVAADDVAIATQLLSEHWLSLVARGHAEELVGWIDRLSPRVVRDSAELAIAGAGAALALEDLEQAQRFIAAADPRAAMVPAKRRDRYVFGRALVAMFNARVRGDCTTTQTAAHKVLAARQLAGLPGDSRALAHLSLGIAEQWSAPRGASFERLEQALELAQRHSSDYIVLDCLGQLALFKALDGALREAVEFASAAADIASRNGWDEHAMAAVGPLAMAIASLNWADFDDAAGHVARAARATRRSGARTTLSLIELLRATLIERTDAMEAARIAHAAAADIEAWNLPSRLAAMAGYLEARILAGVGLGDRAREALARGGTAAQAPVEHAVISARLALADSDPAGALRQLHAGLLGGARAQYPATDIEASGLSAVAKHLLHDDQSALDLVEQALSRAQPNGYRWPLLVLGPPLRDLLKRRIRAGTRHRALAGEVLELLEDERSSAETNPPRLLLDPLSDREEAVLRYLPTVMSKAEIASELFVSVNTVKTHTKNIYRKLGVSTRTEAVGRARRLKLV